MTSSTQGREPTSRNEKRKREEATGTSAVRHIAVISSTISIDAVSIILTALTLLEAINLLVEMDPEERAALIGFLKLLG
jgi:hypothetical protein